MQGDGLHDGRHAHAVHAEAREDPGLGHRLVLGAAQDRVDALTLTHPAQRIRHLSVPHGRHVQEQRPVEGRGTAKVHVVGDRHDVTEIPVFQAPVRVRENRAADPGSNGTAG